MKGTPVNNVTRVYGKNILMKPLGDFLSAKVVEKRLHCLPPKPPPDIARIPVDVRIHQVARVRELFIPPLVAPEIHQSIDIGVRTVYSYRNPELASEWAQLSGAQ